MEKQMKEIADQAGASKDQFDEAMKLAKTVLEKKDDSNVESAVAAVAAANQNAEQDGSSGQADQIEEELDQKIFKKSKKKNNLFYLLNLNVRFQVWKTPNHQFQIQP